MTCQKRPLATSRRASRPFGAREIWRWSRSTGGRTGAIESPAAHRRFAYALVEEAGTEIVHGHSSHHPKSIEVHGGRLILYGCGDFINDYEGIGGYEEFAPDLSLLYLADVDSATGNLQRLRTAPFQIGGMRLNEADSQMRAWLVAMIEDPARGGGLRVRQDGLLALHWQDEFRA